MSEYYIIEREWTETLQGAELLLYAYIATTCKNCDGVCQCSKANISHWTGVGERWLGRALESLQKRGLITIEEQAGKYNKYIAHPYTKSVPLHQKCTPTLKVGETPTPKVYPHIIIKEKLKREIITRAYIDEDFRVCFERWLDYKKARRETYKTPMSEQSCYNRLKKLAGGDAQTAAEIVEQSIANNWAGLFELKTTKANGNNRRQADYSDAVNRAIIAGLCSQQ